MKSTIIATVILSLGIIIGAGILSGHSSVSSDQPEKNNVSVSSGTQIVELEAKGGFTPRKSSAEAGLPTILRVDTSGTFDCSSIIRIPSLNITKNLPASGVTDIDLGKQVAGTINGTCGMGMYPFQIIFN